MALTLIEGSCATSLIRGSVVSDAFSFEHVRFRESRAQRGMSGCNPSTAGRA
jgi:hypothetical protein